MRLVIPLAELKAAWRSLDLVIGDSYERSRVRFEASGESVSISATDLDQLLTVDVSALVDGMGSFVASGPALGEYILEQGGEELVIELANRTLQLSSATGEFRASLFDDALWPRSDHLTGPTTTWPITQLEAIGRVGWAASKDDARPLQKGVQLQGAMAVAMDSYGMAAVRTPMAATTQVVIPARSLGIAGKLPVTAEGYQFTSNSRHATIASRTWRLTTTLLEGTLPEWKHLFADPSEPRITSPKVELAAALHRVRGLAKRAELRTVVIRPDPSGDGIVLRVSVPDVGDQTARAAGTCHLEAIGLNFERITHAIDNLPTDQVKIEVVDQMGYAVIRDDDYIAVIPPVRGAS